MHELSSSIEFFKLVDGSNQLCKVVRNYKVDLRKKYDDRRTLFHENFGQIKKLRIFWGGQKRNSHMKCHGLENVRFNLQFSILLF